MSLCVVLSGPLVAGCQSNSQTVADLPATSRTPTASASGALFVDKAQAAGLNFRWKIPGQRPFNLLQTIGNGCAFLDYNNDDNLDILLVSSQMALYKGDGKGRFQDVTRQAGLHQSRGYFLGCAVGDYDNDGYSDLYISGYRSGVLLRNNRGRGFQDVTRQAGLKPQPWGTSCAFADIDGSGRLSLYVANYVVFGPDTQPKLCNHNGHMGTCGPTFYKPEFGVLYLNVGGGRFRDVTKQWGAERISGKTLGASFADFDDSGRQSLALSNDETSANLLRNMGGRFSDIAAAAGTAYDASGNTFGGMGQDWGDYNNDGRLDLAVATFAHEPKCIYQNVSNGIFEDRSSLVGIGKTPLVAFGEKWLDFDNDGWLDLIISHGHIQDDVAKIDETMSYRQITQLFHNQNGAQFANLSAQAGPDLQKPIVGRGLTVGDYDNDGRVDALVVDSEGSPLLLHNESTKTGRWLTLKLEGTKSNRDAYGALVTAKFKSNGKILRIVRRCGTDGSYLSASDHRVHIGLASANRADISIKWPSGKTDRYGEISANQTVTLREGSSRVVSTVRK